MFGLFKGKGQQAGERKRPAMNVVDNLLVFKDYCIAGYREITSPTIPTLSDEDLAGYILANILSRDASPSSFCASVQNPIFEKVRIAVLFFETDVAMAMVMDNSMACCVLEPIVESTGLSAFDGMEMSMRVTSKLVAIQNHDKPGEAEAIMFRDANLIISKLLLERHKSA